MGRVPQIAAKLADQLQVFQRSEAIASKKLLASLHPLQAVAQRPPLLQFDAHVGFFLAGPPACIRTHLNGVNLPVLLAAQGWACRQQHDLGRAPFPEDTARTGLPSCCCRLFWCQLYCAAEARCTPECNWRDFDETHRHITHPSARWQRQGHCPGPPWHGGPLVRPAPFVPVRWWAHRGPFHRRLLCSRGIRK